MNLQQSEIKNKIREWWDNPSQDYDGFVGHGVNSEIEKELWGDEIAKLLGRKQNQKILDIGTGTGFLALLLAGMGYSVTAVDWSTTMMQRAREKANASQIPILFEVQYAENLTFPDGSFDAVVACGSLMPVFAQEESGTLIAEDSHKFYKAGDVLEYKTIQVKTELTIWVR